jgi:putative transcriptional regulator
MRNRFRSAFVFFGAMFVALSCWTASSRAEEAAADESVVLVAKPELQGDPVYASTILIAKPLPDGRALGFIMNRPTSVTLGELFPQDASSQKVAEPVFVGGPVGTNLIFALVRSTEAPGEGAVKLAPELYLAVDATLVDQVIRGQPEQARFFAGFVVWEPGELNDELKRGFWYEMEPDARQLMRKTTDGLWEDLLGQSQKRAGTI